MIVAVIYLIPRKRVLFEIKAGKYWLPYQKTLPMKMNKKRFFRQGGKALISERRSSWSVFLFILV